MESNIASLVVMSFFAAWGSAYLLNLLMRHDHPSEENERKPLDKCRYWWYN